MPTHECTNHDDYWQATCEKINGHKGPHGATGADGAWHDW